MAIDVEDVCTDLDLEIYTVGRSNLQDIIPNEWLDETLGRKSAAQARQQVLSEVLSMLRMRRPPILESDLADLTELKLVVCFGTLAMLYMGAATNEESPYLKKAKHFSERYATERSSLQPTVLAGATASNISAWMSRG